MKPADNDGKRTGAYLHRGKGVNETQVKHVSIHGAGKRLQTQGGDAQTDTTTSAELVYTVFQICKYVWLLEVNLTQPSQAEQQCRELSNHISPLIIYW